MSATSLTSLESLAAAIPDGALLAVPKDSSGVAMAATRALIRRGVRNLHLVCVPTSGLQADLLIGAGDRKSTRLNSSHPRLSRMPSSA